MMDSHEAIRGLDHYSEMLVSQSALLGAPMLAADNEDQEAVYRREHLLIEIKKRRADGRWLALEITKGHDLGDKPRQFGDLDGISAAVQRFILADNQASEALNKVDEKDAPNQLAVAIQAFREKHGMVEK